MKRYVSVFFDVEDPHGEFADDAALDVVRICDSLGIRGTFCLTGEKCRVLKARGRSDVVEALKRHALGFHTNTHSLHPTTMELLEKAGWADGVQAVYEAEKPGVDAFEELFGSKPVCWAGAGFTWGPQVAEAIERLGIPSYAYARTFVPGGQVHRFAGRIGFPHHGFVLEEELDRRSTMGAALLRTQIQFLLAKGPWLGFFGGHPTKMRYSDFWDNCYAFGRTPEEYVPVPPQSLQLYGRRLVNLNTLLSLLASKYQVIGLDEALQMPWTFERLNSRELGAARKGTLKRLDKARRWPIHKPDLDVSSIVAQTLDRLPEIERGRLDGQVKMS